MDIHINQLHYTLQCRSDWLSMDTGAIAIGMSWSNQPLSDGTEGPLHKMKTILTIVSILVTGAKNR